MEALKQLITKMKQEPEAYLEGCYYNQNQHIGFITACDAILKAIDNEIAIELPMKPYSVDWQGLRAAKKT